MDWFERHALARVRRNEQHSKAAAFLEWRADAQEIIRMTESLHLSAQHVRNLSVAAALMIDISLFSGGGVLQGAC